MNWQCLSSTRKSYLKDGFEQMFESFIEEAFTVCVLEIHDVCVFYK
jgi:hypothetical protein